MMLFFGIHISQGSVVTRLGCGEVFVYDNNNNNDRLTAFDPGQPG